MLNEHVFCSESKISQSNDSISEISEETSGEVLLKRPHTCGHVNAGIFTPLLVVINFTVAEYFLV